MSFLPQIHPATVPYLKNNSIDHRILPFFVESEDAPHIGVTHWHDYMQLWYTHSGSFTITVNGKKMLQKPGQLTIIPPYLIHSIDSSKSTPATLRCVRVSLYDDLFENNIAPLYTISHNTIIFEDKILPNSFIFTNAEKELADSIFSELLKEFSKHHEMRRASIYKNIISALSLLSKHSESIPESSTILREFEQFKLITSATDFIAQNYNKDVSIKTLSNHMLMSQSSFSNKFKHTTGQPFLSYCKRTKLARAIWLLRLSGKTLSEIADECNFYDSTHLSHTIKSALGISPLIFRAQMLEQNRTYGLGRHLRQMQKLAWMNAMSEDEIAYFRRCAIGMPD